MERDVALPNMSEEICAGRPHVGLCAILRRMNEFIPQATKLLLQLRRCTSHVDIAQQVVESRVRYVKHCVPSVVVEAEPNDLANSEHEGGKQHIIAPSYVISEKEVIRYA